MLFALLFISYSLIYMTKNCYSAAMAAIVDGGIMTKSETGLIAAMFYIIYAPFQIVGGIAADKLSPAKLIVFGSLGAALCNLLVYIFSGNYVAMIIIWSLNAVVQFGIWPSIFKIVVSELCEEHRTRGVFFINFSVTAGLVLSYGTALFIKDWRMNFLLSAITLFVIAAVFFFIYRALSSSMLPYERTKEIGSTGDKKRHTGTLRIVIASGVPLIMIVSVTQGLLNIGLKGLVPVMLMESYDSIGPTVANALNIILILASPVGLFLGRAPFLKKLNYPMALAALLSVSVPMLIIMTYVGRAHVALIMTALVILAVAISAMAIYASYVSKSFEWLGVSATLAGLFNCMVALGIVLANYVFTKIAESYGWNTTVIIWLVLACLSLALSLIATPLWKRFLKKREKMQSSVSE